MIGEGGSHFEKDDLFFLLHNCLPDRDAAMLSYFVRGEEVGSWENLHL